MLDRLSPEFVALQLALADRFAEIGAGNRAEGVHRLTNLQRRLGLGVADDPPTNNAWLDLLDRLDASGSSDERVDLVMDARASLPAPIPLHVAEEWPTVGAFSIQVQGTLARTHFHPADVDGRSPLDPSKAATRRRELADVLSLARSAHPEIERVRGGSWLYSTRSYTALFPAAHVATAVVRRGRSTFRGMSHWGQFLDHRGPLKDDLAGRFLARVRAWDGDDPCGLFPIPTLEVESPISAFGSARSS